MEREFLGWDGMPLERAADWLVERFDADMAGVLVALPGARSGRLLGERIARLAGPALRPPKVVTAGLASDELLEVGGTPAGRLVRTLAWQKALAELDPGILSRIVARAPGRDDMAGWMRLAEEVRGLFGEVAAEGLQFDGVAKNELLAPLEGEQQRWKALATAQTRMAELLANAGFVDPHLGRLRAIESKSVRSVREIVLVGVSEMNALLRSALDLCQATATALVFAPDEHAERFDEHGALIPEAWSDFEIDLDAESQWFVADRPVDQAEQTVRVIAGWNGEYAAEQISLGLADHEVAPYLQGHLTERGVTARDAAGTPMGRTRPVLLLEAVGRFAEGGRFANLAALLRHPDFEAALRRDDAELEPVELVDAYHNAHLPWRADGDWLSDPDDKRDRFVAAGMGRVWRATEKLLADLLEIGERSVTAVAPVVQEFLTEVYGERELDPAHEPDRILIASLSRLGEALTELQGLPAVLAPTGSGAATISLLLRSVAAHEVPPAPARAGEPTVEMLGWLELPLDDAPALVVSGFEDGRVPESVRGDAFLPNRLRQSLGIVDNAKRLARDLYATELLLRSRERVAFVSGRRSVAGDPQLPSRILFHCPEEQVVPRVKRFIGGSKPSVPRVQVSADSSRALPRLDVTPEIESIPVTAFGRFLSSPYQFYLERVARLETLDDRTRELDPMSFGTLAHDVLERFGRDAQAREQRDAEEIAKFLVSTLQGLGRERYGAHPLPAVQLQLRQLEQRLEVFAAVQARRRQAGWEIRETEWKPADGGVEFPVDGTPIRLTGRIDRIDWNPETQQWALWDYKTGESVRHPRTVHVAGDGSWRDLQLPLYCLLAVELLGDAEPAEVGYIALPRDPNGIGFVNVDRWGGTKSDPLLLPDALDGAFEAARDVVRRIRKGDFFSADGFDPRDPIYEAIGGVGIVAGAEDEGAE
jgi:hypothetical protein